MKNPHKILPELELNWELAEKMMMEFIRTEVTRTGFNKVTMGLSGGIDSALAAYLAVKALGGENVLLLAMPYATSSPDSITHAQKMAEFLGVDLATVNITGPADSIFKICTGMDSVRKGNVMARLRMVMLFDNAAATGALVLGTGNKTEILLGYSTLFGDSACSLNAIGDLYKTQVWAFSAFLELPEAIIAKAPSADLWEGQTDEDELGISYVEADEILYHLVDKRLSPDAIVNLGFKAKLVNYIYLRIRKYHFKSVLPPIPKMSPRTVGADFLYARDWGTQ